MILHWLQKLYFKVFAKILEIIFTYKKTPETFI